MEIIEDLKLKIDQLTERVNALGGDKNSPEDGIVTMCRTRDRFEMYVLVPIQG